MSKARLSLHIREATKADATALESLHHEASKVVDAHIRQPEEIRAEYLQQVLSSGVTLVACTRGKQNELLGAVHGLRQPLRAFSHLLTDVTLVVHPQYYARGLERRLLESFLKHIQQQHQTILRVETMLRESDVRGLLLFETLCFSREGRCACRLRSITGDYIAQVPLAWFNPAGGL